MNSRWSRSSRFDAETGRPIRDFGDTGVVDLTKDLGRIVQLVDKLSLQKRRRRSI